MPSLTDEERAELLRQNVDHLASLGARVEIDYGDCKMDEDGKFLGHGINCECFGYLERPRVARYVVYGAWKEYKPHEWPTQ